MIDTWNPAKLNEKISGRDSWNPAILNEGVNDRDSWNPAILNESAGETPVVFEATITASFPEGAACTATDGTTTLTADDNPMAFNIPNEGTWAVACVANGVTFSEDVVITTNGQTEAVDLTPVGSTITPTDSVGVLIACAGIGDSTYTTISDVIADSDLLKEITTNDNAIAYLVRSTTFAATMVADEDTMAAIGASNGCSDALLSDSTWLNAICNSTYFESVLNVKVPVMTSNTTPSGVASASNETTAAPAWQGFDGNINTVWSTKSGYNTNQYLAYQFTGALKVRYATITPGYRGNRKPKTYKIQASSDGNTWIDLTTNFSDFTNTDSVETKSHAFICNTDYAYYRVFIIDNYGETYINISDVQFYGRVDI